MELGFFRALNSCFIKIKKQLFFFLSIFICFIFLSSCNTTKEATSSKDKNNQEAKALNELEFKGTYLEGVKQYLLGNYEVAESLFTQCIHKKESHDPSLYQLAKISLAQNNFFQAKEYVKKAININQSNSWYKLLLIDILLIQNKPTEAIQIYSQLLDKHPNKIEYLKNVSKLYIGLGKYQEALETLNKLGSIKGTSAEISLTKIEIYKQLNQSNNIISEYKTLIDANPFEYKYQTLLAEFLTSLEKYDEAFDIYQRIVEQNPEDNTVKLSLYEYYSAINEPKKAINILKEVFKDNHVDPNHKLNFLVNNFQKEEEIEFLKLNELINIVDSIHPNNYNIKTFIGDYYLSLNKLEKATGYYQQALEINQSSYSLWEQLLRIEIQLSDYQSLLVNSNKAIDLFPNQAMLYFFKGIAAYFLEDYKEASETLEDGLIYIIDNKQLKLQFYTYLAESYNELKIYDKSDYYFDNLLTLDPENPVILNNYSYYLSLRGEKLDSALRYIQKCIEIEGNSPTYLDTYAWVLYKLGNYDKAKTIISKAIELGGNDEPVILEHFGDILYRLGKKDKALEIWKEAQNKGKGTEYLEEKIRTKTLIE